MTKPLAIQLPLCIRDRRRRHWHWAPDIIIDEYAELLGAGGLAVYYALSRFANRETEIATPNLRTLAKHSGLSVRSVQRQLRRLERFGLLSADLRAGTSTEYTLLDPPRELGDFLVRRAASETLDTQSPRPATLSPLPHGHPELDVVVDGSSQEQSVKGLQEEEQQQHSSLGDTRGGGGTVSPLVQLLVEFGIVPSVAREVVIDRSQEQVAGWIAYCYHPDHIAKIHNPHGFVIERLRANDPPPTEIDAKDEVWQRYLGGEFGAFVKH